MLSPNKNRRTGPALAQLAELPVSTNVRERLAFVLRDTVKAVTQSRDRANDWGYGLGSVWPPPLFFQGSSILSQRRIGQMKTNMRWFVYEYKNGELVILSKPFKTKEAAEKERLKLPERERQQVGVGRSVLNHTKIEWIKKVLARQVGTDTQ